MKKVTQEIEKKGETLFIHRLITYTCVNMISTSHVIDSRFIKKNMYFYC